MAALGEHGLEVACAAPEREIVYIWFWQENLLHEKEQNPATPSSPFLPCFLSFFLSFSASVSLSLSLDPVLFTYLQGPGGQHKVPPPPTGQASPGSKPAPPNGRPGPSGSLQPTGPCRGRQQHLFFHLRDFFFSLHKGGKPC